MSSNRTTRLLSADRFPGRDPCAKDNSLECLHGLFRNQQAAGAPNNVAFAGAVFAEFAFWDLLDEAWYRATGGYPARQFREDVRDEGWLHFFEELLLKGALNYDPAKARTDEQFASWLRFVLGRLFLKITVRVWRRWNQYRPFPADTAQRTALEARLAVADRDPLVQAEWDHALSEALRQCDDPVAHRLIHNSLAEPAAVRSREALAAELDVSIWRIRTAQSRMRSYLDERLRDFV